MKKMITVVVMVLLTGVLFGQEKLEGKWDTKNSLGFDVFEVAFSTINIAYERNISNSLAVGLNSRYTFKSNYNYRKGFIEEFSLKYNIIHKRTKRTKVEIYSMAFTQIRSIDMIHEDYDYETDKDFTVKENVFGYGGGFLGGMRIIASSGLYLSAYAGSQVRFVQGLNNVIHYHDYDEQKFTGIALRGGIRLGFKF